MAEDRLLKSGQLTFTRLLFLAAAGGVIVATVALGGVWLYIGYWLLTAALCVPLFLIARDYGINLEKVEPDQQAAQRAQVEAAPAAEGVRTTIAEPRPRRRASRPAKRRR